MSHCEMTQCPNCKSSWLDDREIPEVLFEENRARYPTIEAAREAAASYGWTPENKLRPGKDVVGVQYSYRHPQHYDGVSEWQCMRCKARVGRWTKKVLADDESEQRFGG